MGASIRELVRDYNQAFGDGDYDRLLGFLHPDLVFGGAAARDLSGVAPGTTIAAAVLTLEPVAYQLKGAFAGMRRSLGQAFGVIDVREAYSACPPLPGQALPMTR